MNVRTSEPDGLRVLLFFGFDHRAPHDEVTEFKERLISCNHVLHSVEVSGPYDFIVEAEIPDVHTYNERLKSIADEIARLVERYEACFICKRFIRESGPNHCLWIPGRDALKRIDCHEITKIVAEGDYMRIYCGVQSWLYHTTMTALLNQLDPDEFLHVHRSVILNIDFIDRVVHRGTRWVARLNDGTSQVIARSHVPTVMKQLRTDMAKPDVSSAKIERAIEQPAPIIEDLLSL